jgi:shikimate dehydrogenase
VSAAGEVETRSIKLGLIGDNIAASKAPLLHRLAGRLCGVDLTYDLLPPAAAGLSFDALFDRCAREGYRGLNITLPYKETVVSHLQIDVADIAAIGACNTVLFDRAPPRGFNTDYSGFIAAFTQTFGEVAPGTVAIAGAGGVGKAIAFALAQLGAAELRLFDLDRRRADATAHALALRYPGLTIELAASVESAADGADGIVNCTPRGMVGYGGTAFPVSVMNDARWAFDAVYTPIETEFVVAARAHGLVVMSGYELFLHQGIDAFRIFSGRAVDPHALRAALATAATEADGGAVSPTR